MYPPIFATCYANAGVKSLLGTTPCRLYPFGEAPEDVATPYAVWQTLTGGPFNVLNGAPDTDAFDLQVDVYAATEASARSVAQAIRTAIESTAYLASFNGEGKEQATQLYRYSFDINWITDA